jgi:hypothetical protein
MSKMKIELYFDTFEEAASQGYFDAKKDPKTKRWCKKYEVNYHTDYYIVDADGFQMGSKEV